MLMVFALSGLWQTLPTEFTQHHRIFAMLSSIHESHGMKLGTLTSVYMRWFVVLMTLSLIFTIILGVIMAFKFGHKRSAVYCLLAGIVTPTILVLLVLLK